MKTDKLLEKIRKNIDEHNLLLANLHSKIKDNEECDFKKKTEAALKVISTSFSVPLTEIFNMAAVDLDVYAVTILSPESVQSAYDELKSIKFEEILQNISVKYGISIESIREKLVSKTKVKRTGAQNVSEEEIENMNNEILCGKPVYKLQTINGKEYFCELCEFGHVLRYDSNGELQFSGHMERGKPVLSNFDKEF